MADTIIVGRYLGSAGLTAASNASSVMMLFLLFCMGLNSAGQIVVSQHVGAGNKDRLSRTIGTVLTLDGIAGVLFIILPLLLGRRVLALLNVPREAWDGAIEYITVCSFGNLAVTIYNGFSAVLRGMGDSKHPMIFVIISSVLNVILDLIFVGPLGMGCFGAGLATVISQYVSCIACIWFAVRNKEAFGFDFKWTSFQIDNKELKPVVKLGIPMIIQNFTIMVSMLFITARINGYGLAAAAVTAVGGRISMIAGICTMALNTAGSTIIGQSFAARKMDRITKTLGCVLLLSGIFAALLSLILVLFPEQVFGLFDSDPEVLELCHLYILPNVIDMFGYACRATAFAFINGIGFSSLAFVGGLIDGLIGRIGLALLFEVTLQMGLRGLWLGSVIAGYTFMLIGTVYFITGKWKTRKTLIS